MVPPTTATIPEIAKSRGPQPPPRQTPKPVAAQKPASKKPPLVPAPTPAPAAGSRAHLHRGARDKEFVGKARAARLAEAKDAIDRGDVISALRMSITEALKDEERTK